MYRKILVPLDGSALAECALPHVRNFLRGGLAGEVTILNASFFQNIPIEHWTPLREKSISYLEDVESKFSAQGMKVKTEYREGDRPAEVISNYVRENGIDLIIIATHGHTGLKKMIFGSVALEVLHNSTVPVLLIKPGSCLT
jgi:nucleotide-binding universal stress UspA family protein